MQNQTMTALLVAINSKNGRTFNSLQLAEMYGISDKAFRDYVWLNGWLAICNHSDYFSAEDAAFLIYQIGESRVKWINKDIVSDIFESEPFAKLYASCADGDNSLISRLVARDKNDICLKNKIAEHTESIVRLNNEVSIAKSERDQLKSELHLMIDRANMLEKDNIELKSKFSQVIDLVSNVYQAVKENAQNFIDRNTNGSVKKIFTNGLNIIVEPMDTTIEALKQLK